MRPWQETMVIPSATRVSRVTFISSSEHLRVAKRLRSLPPVAGQLKPAQEERLTPRDRRFARARGHLERIWPRAGVGCENWWRAVEQARAKSRVECRDSSTEAPPRPAGPKRPAKPEKPQSEPRPPARARKR